MDANLERNFWNVLLATSNDAFARHFSNDFKDRVWKGRLFQVVHIAAGTQVKQHLEGDAAKAFHVAVIDLPLPDDALGKDICTALRKTCERFLQILLRSEVPDELDSSDQSQLFNDVDAIHVATPDMSHEQWFTHVCASLRSCRHIAVLDVLLNHIQSTVQVSSNPPAMQFFVPTIQKSLTTLYEIYGHALFFCPEIGENAPQVSAQAGNFSVSDEAIVQALRILYEQDIGEKRFVDGQDLSLPNTCFAIPFAVSSDGKAVRISNASTEFWFRGALLVECASLEEKERALTLCFRDFLTFLENCRIGFATWRLQQNLSKERMLREQTYFERLRSVSNMVTGVSHELNTPLGVANTALMMFPTYIQSLSQGDLPKEERDELMQDFQDSHTLVEKNLARIMELVGRFKQLSSVQLSDERMECNLMELVTDCVQAFEHGSERKDLQIQIHADDGTDFSWEGFPGHFTQVVTSLIKNAIEHAYPDKGPAKVDIRLAPIQTDQGEEGFSVTVQDYGLGIAENIRAHVFEPFVTSGRSHGGVGLGLAIALNTVKELLGGSIAFQTELDQGTTFTFSMPKFAPERYDVFDLS